jgi:putative transposase
MKKRFTEEQIIGVLKEAEAGVKFVEVIRKHGISDATYYNRKAKTKMASFIWSGHFL